MTHPTDNAKDDQAMTNEEIDEIVKWLQNEADEERGEDNIQRSRAFVRAAECIESRKAAHLGYYDTRTHVVVPREPTTKMLKAADEADDLASIDDAMHSRKPANFYFEEAYRAMLAACEEEKP